MAHNVNQVNFGQNHQKQPTLPDTQRTPPSATQNLEEAKQAPDSQNLDSQSRAADQQSPPPGSLQNVAQTPKLQQSG